MWVDEISLMPSPAAVARPPNDHGLREPRHFNFDGTRQSSTAQNTQVHDDSPLTRLDMLRFARRIVEQQAARQLDQIDQRIADEERREHERQQGEQHRPPAPDWLLELGLNRETAAVYVQPAAAGTPVGAAKVSTDRPHLEVLTEVVDHVTAGLSARWSGRGETSVAAVD
ncbi:hypothetical protein, partial [Streptomyces sp. NPDC001153]